VSTFVLRLKGVESFLETSQCTLRTQPRVSGEKPGSRDVKREDFIRYWRRSGLKSPDKPKIFIKKNVRNHSYHQFYPLLAKIRINRGLLYWLSVSAIGPWMADISVSAPKKPYQSISSVFYQNDTERPTLTNATKLVEEVT